MARLQVFESEAAGGGQVAVAQKPASQASERLRRVGHELLRHARLPGGVERALASEAGLHILGRLLG